MAHIVALPWYHRTDWPALHQAFADREAINPCYDQWKSRAIAREQRWRDDGYTVLRVEVRPETFLAWCQQNGRKIDHAARRAYADEVLAQSRVSRPAAAPSVEEERSSA
ncbi:MAG: hypothetical protein AB7O63_10005 [Reyranellaceae bacterium]